MLLKWPYAGLLYRVEIQADSDVSCSRCSSTFGDAGLDSCGYRSGYVTSNSQLARHKPFTLSVDLTGNNYCRSVHTIDPLYHPNHLHIHRDLTQSPWRRKQKVPPKRQFQLVTPYGAKQPLTGIRLLQEFTGFWTRCGNHDASLVRHGTRLQRYVSDKAFSLRFRFKGTVHQNINCYAINYAEDTSTYNFACRVCLFLSSSNEHTAD